jgi:predicted permease
MRSIVNDLRQSIRVFRGSPLFYAALVLTLGLGIGANTSVFSILHAVLLQPLPYSNPDRVVMVWRSRPTAPVDQRGRMLQGSQWRRGWLTAENVAEWRAEAKDVLTDVAAVKSWMGNSDAQFDLLLDDRAERLRGAFVTPNFFELLGVSAARGRLFGTIDERTPEPLAVLSDGLWRRAFGGNPAVVGGLVTFTTGIRPRLSHTFRVVGVLPPAFRFSYPEETEVWVARPWDGFAREPRGSICCMAIARIAPGVSFDAAAARAAALQTTTRVPPDRRDVVRLERVYDWVVGETQPSLLLLAGVAVLLLTITCATVANALLVRVSERRRELAVRASLGATRLRLLRQLLVEGAVLAAAGAAAGILASIAVAPVLRSLIPAVIPRADEIGVDPAMLLFATGAAAVTTIVAALIPAWRGARVELVSTLKSSGTAASSDPGTGRWRHALVAMQVSVATILLISSALLLTSFWHLRRVPLGFDGQHVLTVQMTLLDQKYMGKRSPAGEPTPSPVLESFRQALVRRVEALPGVVDAGLTSAVPFRGTDFTMVLSAVGETKTVVGNGRFVDPGYFSVLRIPLLRGRLFSAHDTAASERVAILSESYARQMFGSDDPIGKRIDPDEPAEVVGVVGDVRYVARDSEPQPALYFPASQGTSLLICLVARTAPNAGDIGPAVRQIIHDLDPAQPAMKMTTIDQIVNESVANRRFYTTATGAFAALALALTIAGLAVIIARTVVERRRELAIRTALGATARRIVGLVLRQGLWPIGIGTALGIASAYVGALAIAPFLFEVGPRQPLVYAAAGTFIVLVAVSAAFVPARRAADIAPASVLKAQ